MNTPATVSPRVSLFTLAWTFFHLGATTFGGMWGSTERIEDELVRRHEWLQAGEYHFMVVAATLIPAPKFIGLGGLVGYRLRGWTGSAVCVFCLITPGALLVLLAVLLIRPELLTGALAPAQRVINVAVVGILFGSARRQISAATFGRRTMLIGRGLTLLVTLSVLAGVPLLAAVAIAFAAGPFLVREEAKP